MPSFASLSPRHRIRRLWDCPAPGRLPAVLLGLLLGFATMARTPALAAPAGPAAVDIALVLAVDVSFSMDARELDLQREGYQKALRSDEVMRAIRSGFSGRIAVTYAEWAGPGTQAVLVPWTVIDSPAAADAFAARITPQEVMGRHGTSISSALAFSASLLDESGFLAQRRVIDVSGDGPNNMGPPVEGARDAVVARGIVINGLPLVLYRTRTDRFSIPNLDTYYRDCVIGGEASFMIPVTTIEGFEEAVRRKLVLEIAARDPPVPLVRIKAHNVKAQNTDCLIGERLRGSWDWQR